MSLKQSCFKSVYKSDLKRFWWISALFSLGMILIVGTPFLAYVRDYFADAVESGIMSVYEHRRINTYLYGNYVFAAAIGAFLSMGLFSYNSNVASVTFYHSLPIKRSKLMMAHTLSALTLIAIPIVLNTAFCAFALGQYYSVKPVIISMLLYFVYALLAFSVFTFIGTLTGNVPSQAVFSVIFSLIPLFIAVTLSVMCEDFLFGFHNNEKILDVFTEWIYLSPEALMSSKVFVYLAFIVVFYVLSLFVYEKRNLENFGEVIAFPQLKGLFKVLFGICFGILGYFYFKAFWSIEILIVMFVFGSIGVIIANMLVNKSFSLKGIRNALICNAVFVAAMICIFKFDIMGFEKRIPDVNDVEYAEILNYSNDGFVWSHIEDYGYDAYGQCKKTDYYSPKFYDKESIMEFTKFQKLAIDNKGKVDVGGILHNELSDVPYYVTIKYTLKNGSTISRQYTVDDKTSSEFFMYIFETPEYLKYKYPVLDETEKNYTAVICDLGFFDKNSDYYDYVEYEETHKVVATEDSEVDTTESEVYTFTKKEDIKKIVEAIKKDRENMSFEEYTLRREGRNTLVSIELNYTVPAILENNGKKYYVPEAETYYITPFDTYTLALLREMNICDVDDLIKNDKIDQIVINEWDLQKINDFKERDYYDNGDDIDKSGYSDKSVVFSTDEDIASFLNYYNGTYSDPVNIFDDNVMRVFFQVNYKDGTVSHYVTMDKYENLPESLKAFAR